MRFLLLTKLKYVQLNFVCLSGFMLHDAIEIILSFSKTPIEILKINKTMNQMKLYLFTNVQYLH